MKNFILLIVAIVLLIILLPISYGYSLISAILKGLMDYHYKLAFSIDLLGNVLIGTFLGNDIMVKPDGHRFGNPKETMSMVFAVNMYHFNKNKLYAIGKFIAWTVNLIDRKARKEGTTHMKIAYNSWLASKIVEYNI